MSEARIDPSFPHLQIVDGNNYLLHRFRAEQEGLVIRNIIADIRQCMKPPLFIFDGMNGNQRRRDIYPSYKVRSEAETLARENSFPTLNLFREVMQHVPCVMCRVDGWEADDVMATIATTSSTPVRIVTTDRDLSQLKTDPNIDVTSGYDTIPPEDVRLYKAFVGDPSDKIPGIKGFGKKSWEYLNKSVARAALEMGTDVTRVNVGHLGMNPATYSWWVANQPLVHDFWEIVGLFDVPVCEIYKNLKVGRPNPEEVNRLLSEFML